jgi:hypothetical protein
MKKIVALLLAVLICLGSFPTFADVDLSGYTQEELLTLRDIINKELLKRGIEKEVIVPIGTYEVGVDIPEGIYRVKPAKSGAGIRVYENISCSYYDFFISEYLSFYDDESIGKLTLKKGNICVIEDGSLSFSPYQGLGF